MSKYFFTLIYIQFTNVLFKRCLLLYIIILRYEEISPSKSSNQLFPSEKWCTYATTVDAGFQESLDWIKNNCQDNVDHHNILAGWCLSLSQCFLIIFTKVCDVLSTKLPLKHFGEMLAMIGLDALDKRVLINVYTTNHQTGTFMVIRFLHLLVWN